jgi:cytoskeleton protein RodZ
MALLGVVLAVGAYAGWYRLSGEGRLPAEAVTAIPQRLASLAEQALPPSSGPPHAIADATPPVMPDLPADLGNLADPAPPVMAISPTSAAAAQLPPRSADGSPAAGLLPTLAVDRIVLRANADAWLMVKDRSGAILLNRTLKAGETWPVPPRPDLLLTAGNAGGTDILVDGAAIPSLGGSGVVRRDLLLDPDQIKDGKLASAAVAPLASTRPRQ